MVKNFQIKVLMVTGVYHPEVNGAANQCRQLVNTLSGKINFKIFTTTQYPEISPRSQIDGIEISRILLKKRRSLGSYCKAVLQCITFFLSRRGDFQIVHLHGFSFKSALVTLLSKIFCKKVIIKMTSVGHDDPIAMSQRGFILNFLFTKADVYIAISPKFKKIYQESDLPLSRLKYIPNGVDLNRFGPNKSANKLELRDHLGLPRDSKMILFVGHWSRSHKNPDLLFYVWQKYVANVFPDSILVFIGSRNPQQFQVESDLVNEIDNKVKQLLNKRVFFVERTDNIEEYYQASDLFVLTSRIEGLPNALLEAMASGLPVIASRLRGITDWIIEPEVNGLLFEPGNKKDLGIRILRILNDSILGQSLGKEARKTILERFSINNISIKYKEIYEDILVDKYKSI